MHSVLKKISQFVLICTLAFGWIFSGWPQIFNFPPEVQVAYAATATKTWSFVSDTESWSATNPAPTQTTPQWQSADGSPVNGSLEMRITGKNKSNSGRIWEIAGTWEAIFGIPAGSTVTEVGSGTGNSYNYRVSEYNVGAAGNSGPFAFYDNTPTLVGTFSAATAFSGLVAWTAKTGAAISVPAGLQASNNTVRFRITNDLATGNNNGAAVTLRQDQIVVTITYTANSAPNAPSQDSPADSATGVSVTPTFTMTATDPDSDDVNYKVTIYSNSACDSTVSTHDQSVTSTGWSQGTPYASGAQGSFTLQAGDSLSNSTQYWWKASAKDPSGTNTFTDSATCNTFTTVAATTISVTITANGTISYGTIVAGGSKATHSGDLNTTITAQNNGNVTEIFQIKGQNTACPWTLAASSGNDQYTHQFCKTTDVSCTSPPTNYTALTTSYQTLYTGVAASASKNFDLRVIVPDPSSCSDQQSVDVVIQAVQE